MSHNASGRTDTTREKKDYFWYFLEMSVTRCERPDRHNKDEREPFLFFLLFVIFILFKYFCFLEKKLKR